MRYEISVINVLICNLSYYQVSSSIVAFDSLKMRQSRVFSQVRKLTDFTDLKITRISAYQVDLPLHEGRVPKIAHNILNLELIVPFTVDTNPCQSFYVPSVQEIPSFHA